jgi:hypothetical protein
VHFGHRDSPGHGQLDGNEPIAVDEGLEQAIDGVQAAVDAYLGTASAEQRDALVAALGHLDELTALGDDYTNWRAATRWGSGVSPGASVLGARSSSPIAEELPTRVLQAQITLVRRAKDAVADGGPATSDALRTAAAELTSAQNPSADGGPGSAAPPADPGAPAAPPPPPTPPPPAVPPQPGLP